MLIEYNKVNIYQADEMILEGVDFHVDADQFIYIIGKVGSGKSTLLKTLYCEVDIDKNDAETANVLGRDLTTLKRKEVPALRRDMGIIFQDFQLLHDRNIYKNLEFVLHSTGWKNKKEIDDRIDNVLAAVGMEDKKMKCPHELSGGEQQRIAIARALLNQPKVIIADEPTGNLDPDTAWEIMQLLDQINMRGTTIVMVTHAKDIVDKMGKRVIAIEKGRIVRDEFGAYGYEEALAEMEMTDDTLQSKRTFRSRFRRGGDEW